MPIPISCAVCGQSYQLRDEMAGKCVRCRCGQAIAAPEGGSVFNLLDELPPTTRTSSSPAPRLTNQQTNYSKRRTAARPSWLIPVMAVIDPCDGQPLRYRVELTEYLIYSVGADGVDDGGRLAAPGQSGDAVVRVRRRDAEGR